MIKQCRRHSIHKPRPLTLPELDQSKNSVLNTLLSVHSRCSYQHAMDELIAWYCSEPRLASNRIVPRYRMHLESIPQAPASINLRLAAVRRPAYEATDSGLLSPEPVAGIRRVKGCETTRTAGRRLSGQQLLGAVRTEALRGKRKATMLSVLLGCAFDDPRLPTSTSRKFSGETDTGRLSTW